ncbi:hypothetical protein Tco_0115170 [Tanacetum coccineum]
MNSIKQCIIERASHEQELKMTLKKLSERQLQIQQCKVQEIYEVLPSETSSTNTPLIQELWGATSCRDSFLMYLKKAQSEKPYLYEIPFDTSDPANRFAPERQETMTVDNETLQTKSVTACNDSSNSRTSNVNAVCAECGKCVFNSNHDACVSRYLNDVNARTKKPKVVPISASKPKRKANKSIATPHKKTVASDTTIQKPKSYFKELYENTNKAWKWWIEKKCPSEYKWTQTTPSRPSLKWKPTGRIFSNVHLRWIPTGKLLNSCTGKVESEPTHGSNVDIPHIHACKQTLGLSAGTSFNGQKQQRIDLNADALYNVKQENLRVWLLKMLISKKPVPECSGLVPQCQMTSDHNSSELAIQDHNNEQSSSKLVPKVVP